MKAVRQLGVFLANFAWLLACLPGALTFYFAIFAPRFTQRRLLRTILKRAADTRYGREHEFERMAHDLNEFQSHPVSDYEKFRPFVDAIASGETSVLTAEAVTLLQPTSGTSSARKLIPLTSGLLRQFHAAIAPWIAGLYLLRPRLLFGRQYWCISPNMPPPAIGSTVPVGFADDTEYLGAWQRWFAAKLMVAPPELARVEDAAVFEFLTLLFLVREKNLRLISVWHPSFLTLLLAALPRHADRMAEVLRNGKLPAALVLPKEIQAALNTHLSPDPKRSDEFVHGISESGTELTWLWPQLQVISCWVSQEAEPKITQLRRTFPQVKIQPKGLLATEGVVSIPWGFSNKQVAAVRSHYLEFLESSDINQVKSLGELQRGKTYSVMMSTAGGLFRYQLHDRVRVTGFCGRTPALEFLGREGLVSDLCGEKLSGEDVEFAIEQLQRSTGWSFDFAMVAPDTSGITPGYVAILETEQKATPSVIDIREEILDQMLQKNFHYAHARRLGQLRPLRVWHVRNATLTYRNWLVQRGHRTGEIKFPQLCKEASLVEAFRDL